MKGRALALFLLTYLSLDVGNPFMPGAVTFVEGRIAVVDASRPSGLDLPMPVVSDDASAPLDEPVLDRHALGSAGAAPVPLPWIPPRRPGLSSAELAPGPDDD
jgi:hypothetical protein